MSNAVPRQVLGLAILLNVIDVVAVGLGLLLCFMLWNHSRHFSYILGLSASTTLGATIGLIRHFDYTLNWRTIKIERYEYSQQPGYTQSSLYGNSDVGWRSRIDSVSLYTYNVDALLVMFWAFALTAGTSSNIRIKPETRRLISIACKVIAFALPAVVVGLCSSQDIQQMPPVYLAVYNLIMFVCLTTGFFLVVTVLFKYLRSRHIFSRLFYRTDVESRSSMRRGSRTIDTVTTANKKTPTDKWLVGRFSIIMAILLVMEAAQITYEIVNFKRNRNKVRTAETAPDFSPSQATVDIAQYIPGEVPSILAFCIFGTTAPFRRQYARFLRRCFCCCARRRQRSRRDPVPWLMLQSRPHAHAECVSFPEDSAALKAWQEQDDPEAAAKIQVKTEILTSVTTAPCGREDSPDAISAAPDQELKDFEFGPSPGSRRVSFGGTSISSPTAELAEPDQEQPCVALASPHWKGRPIVADAVALGRSSPRHGPQVETWAWLSLSREPSVSSMRSHERERHDWSAPTTPGLPTRAMGFPVLDEVDVDAPERVLIAGSVSPSRGRTMRRDR